MGLKEALEANFNFANLILKGAYVLCIAIVFEFIAFVLLRRVERWVSPLLSNDAGREHAWRIRRRSTLRGAPKALVRTLVYGVALILVFDVFGVPVLPLSLAVGSLTAITGAALLPILRDLAQGYTLLAEDALAVGDVVQIDTTQGMVERFTLRTTILRDREGHLVTLSNRDIHKVVSVQRKAESQLPHQDPNAVPHLNKPAKPAAAPRRTS
jgi:small conductance mechanosensitive channel